ncbi:hypothetical protein RvY_00352-2 [Ramazzottius varieornatus]|uniref:Uncharacterized protein n=1 Tax=Ramazzottius varieornatus TaxID=947166 RepID=A0A1D1UDF4_RAMVA|nr:hypothetical protein RvY_00352-2 [Ramazzottius varieornatus]
MSGDGQATGQRCFAQADRHTSSSSGRDLPVCRLSQASDCTTVRSNISARKSSGYTVATQFCEHPSKSFCEANCFCCNDNTWIRLIDRFRVVFLMLPVEFARAGT